MVGAQVVEVIGELLQLESSHRHVGVVVGVGGVVTEDYLRRPFGGGCGWEVAGAAVMLQIVLPRPSCSLLIC